MEPRIETEETLSLARELAALRARTGMIFAFMFLPFFG